MTTAAPPAAVAYTPPPPDVMRFYASRWSGRGRGRVRRGSGSRAMKRLLTRRTASAWPTSTPSAATARPTSHPCCARRRSWRALRRAHFDAGRNATTLFVGERTSPRRQPPARHAPTSTWPRPATTPTANCPSRCRPPAEVQDLLGPRRLRRPRGPPRRFARSDGPGRRPPPDPLVDGVLKADRPAGAGSPLLRRPARRTRRVRRASPSITRWARAATRSTSGSATTTSSASSRRGGAVDADKWGVTAGAGTPVEKEGVKPLAA